MAWREVLGSFFPWDIVALGMGWGEGWTSRVMHRRRHVWIEVYPSQFIWPFAIKVKEQKKWNFGTMDVDG